MKYKIFLLFVITVWSLAETNTITSSADESCLVSGWNEIDKEWYYVHLDGRLNLGELVIDNAVYEFSGCGALESARCLEETGGGPYEAGCYDEVTQALFDDLNEEKKDLFFDEHSDRNDDYDGGAHGVYDRYASFKMDMNLNKAAAHRLAGTMDKGYMREKIPEEGTINDYLASISYRENATCFELYIRGCEDEKEVFSKIMEMTEDKYESKEDMKYSLEYYRSLGIAHEEKEGNHYFLIILMR